MELMQQQKSQEALAKARSEIGNDPVRLIESIFRIRDNKGKLIDYKIAEPHKKMLLTGLLGDMSALLRVVNKGRQAGFSTFKMIEDITIASVMPRTYQYYVSSNEDGAKKWLRDVEDVCDDARLWVDGSRIIDIDSRKSTLLEKAFKHFPKDVRKEIEHSYVVGMAASAMERGKYAINVDLDEFAWHIRLKDQQIQVFNAMKHFISQGGMITIQSTPFVRTDLFWKLYINAQDELYTPFYFPIIENWHEIDLSKPLALPIEFKDNADDKIRSALDITNEKIEKLRNSGLYEEKRVKFMNKVRLCLVQKMIIPYWWIDIGLLEADRRSDLDYFKQENLGIPSDVMYRFIAPELIEPRIISQEKFRNDDNGYYIIGWDIAQKRDISAITVGQIIDGIMWERAIYETQEPYPEQVELAKELCIRYKPFEIRIDNTGVGISIGDMIEKEPIFPRLRRIDFNSYIELKTKKEKITSYMAEQFKNALINGTYNLIEHSHALNHVLRVEKIATEAGGIRYTGKKGGERDDHFWSKAILNGNFDISNMMPAFGVQKSGFMLGKKRGIGRLGVLIKKKKVEDPYNRPRIIDKKYLTVG